jgi:hypothetical protein
MKWVNSVVALCTLDAAPLLQPLMWGTACVAMRVNHTDDVMTQLSCVVLQSIELKELLVFNLEQVSQ